MDSVMEMCLSIPSLFCAIRVPPPRGHHEQILKATFYTGFKGSDMRFSFYFPVSHFFLNASFFHSCPEVLM